ncbi:MAG: NAD(+)/NADH kinase [Planctomycetales bacterium]|nr:NAD(+)/NADH kinase [Planctomycetales bacterium]
MTSASETRPAHSQERRPKALLLFDLRKQGFATQVAALRPVIERHLDVVDVVDDLETPLPACDAEIALLLGGDGSMLRAARVMGTRQLPVLGVNLGRLGFLADVRPAQLDEVLPRVASGEYRVVNHLMFQCTLLRDGVAHATRLGLNEVAVLAGSPFAMVEVQLYVDGQMATTYSCDGLIVSTPVGSTAHSLSAGGPILHKSLQAFVVSPISPHTLTMRPVVDAADRIYELACPEPHEGTTLVVDGWEMSRLASHDRVRIERAEAQFQLIEVYGRDYYQTLREKLGWGGRLNLSPP